MASLPRLLGVVGAGQMGAGIAQAAAMAGLQVVLADAHPGALAKGQHAIAASLSKLAAKGKLSKADAETAQQRIATCSALEELNGADMIVEAVTEAEEVKRQLFTKLDQVTPPHVILASNTSSLSITRLASATSRPAEVTYQAGVQLAERMGKVVCTSADRPGFIINRVLMPTINEAFQALMEGVASPHDIDAGIKLGLNHPMGPLQLADFIGLDTCLAIMQRLHDGMGEKYRPCQLLQQYVDAGLLGRKSGKGVYAYST